MAKRAARNQTSFIRVVKMIAGDVLIVIIRHTEVNIYRLLMTYGARALR